MLCSFFAAAFCWYASCHIGDAEPRSDAVNQRFRLRSRGRVPARASMQPIKGIHVSPRPTGWQHRQFPRAYAGRSAARPCQWRMYLLRRVSAQVKPRRVSRSSLHISWVAPVAVSRVSETARWKRRAFARGDADIDAGDDPSGEGPHRPQTWPRIMMASRATNSHASRRYRHCRE